MFCRNCGNPLKDGIKFCSQCGVEVFHKAEAKTGETVSISKEEYFNKVCPPATRKMWTACKVLAGIGIVFAVYLFLKTLIGPVVSFDDVSVTLWDIAAAYGTGKDIALGDHYWIDVSQTDDILTWCMILAVYVAVKGILLGFFIVKKTTGLAVANFIVSFFGTGFAAHCFMFALFLGGRFSLYVTIESWVFLLDGIGALILLILTIIVNREYKYHRYWRDLCVLR